MMMKLLSLGCLSDKHEYVSATATLEIDDNS